MALNILFVTLSICVIVLEANDPVRFISYKNDLVSPITEGKCTVNGKMIEQGDTWYREDYCEKVYCYRSGSLGHMEVRGCAPIAPLNANCTVVNHQGVYPECCTGEIVCNQQPESKSDVEMAEMIRALLESKRKK